MSKRPKTRQTLAEILASCSETLYPDKMGKAAVHVDSTDVEGDTPLHVMLWRGDIHAAKSLIEAGADLNAVGDMSETPLHVATRKGNLEIIALLLDKGADPDVTSEFNQTPRSIAAQMNRETRQLYSNN
jgi:ankyrin repeat protein